MKAIKKLSSAVIAMGLGTSVIPFSAPVYADAQRVVINEVCAKNTSYAAPNGSFYDWIELYNPTGSSIDISGYGLSDKETNPYKYTFPENTVINAGGRLIVFCDSAIPEIGGSYTAAFGLSTSGETLTLTDRSGALIDTITFSSLETNKTYGRVPDGSEDFAIMQMTPNAPNEKNNVIEIEVPKPVFSQDGGFYDSDFQLSITVPQGTKVYYTLDGSTPTASDTEYTAPINVTDATKNPNVLSARTDIAVSSWGGSGATAPKDNVDKAFIVNAVAIDQQGNVSDVVNAAYFIGLQNKANYYKDMKVISLTTDSDNLFDYEKGIYVTGKTYDDWKSGPDYNPAAREWETPANYTQKGAAWERPASMQIYKDGQLAFSQNVGIRIHGGATRSSPQKSFNVYARSEYGASKFDFNLFSGSVRSQFTGKKIKEFESFMLRNGGNDGQYTRFRDKLNQNLVADREILIQGTEPAIVFIDGEFWGHYEITEKLDESFVKAHYGVSKKNICIVKNQELDAGDEETYAEWEQMREWVKSTDFTSDANYKELCSKIDMRSFIDYMSTELYINNSDWGDNNTAMWKSTVVDPENPWSDGKWRFILFDTEYSTNLYGQTSPNTDSFRQLLQKKGFITELFSAVIKNEEFKKQFSLTFMDMANENFSNKKVTALIDEYTAQYKEAVEATTKRFWGSSSGFGGGGFGGGWGGIGGIGGGGGNTSQFDSEVSSVRSFYNSRYQTAASTLKSNLQLQSELSKLTVRNEAAKGDVTINTITPDFSEGSWTGSYYTDYPITVTVAPKEGYTFSHWETSDGKTINSQTAEITLGRETTLTAVYSNGDVQPAVKGDVNLDGNVNIADLVKLQNHVLRRETLTVEQAKNADVYGDGQIDAFDIASLRKILIK